MTNIAPVVSTKTKPPRARSRGGGGRRHGSYLLIGATTPPSPPATQAFHKLRPLGPGEFAQLRALWLRQAALGHRLPAEIGVIVLEGGRL